MQIKNARIFRGGRFRSGELSFGKTIESFSPGGEAVDAKGLMLVPGFVDVHTHGAIGIDATDCQAEEIPSLAAYYASHGVTSFCFTTMTAARDTLKQVMQRVCGFRREGAQAKCAGVHLEGPFLSYKKRGAQAAFNLQSPNLEMLYELNEISGGLLRLITVAPEIDGALAFIREASKVCTVSLGHSTADYEQAMAGFAAGATHVTHLFNGMEPLHHRKPGLVGAALTAGASVELICDGLHIHPAVVLGMHRMFGEKLVVISDSLRCAGLSDGHYDLAGQEIVVTDGKATLLDGTIAGSSSNLHEELKNLVRFGVPLESALTAMTEAPARAVGMEDRIGRLEEGCSADLLLLDDALNIIACFIDGELVYGTH